MESVNVSVSNLSSSSSSNFSCASAIGKLDQINDPFHRDPNTRLFVTALYSSVACIGAIGNLFVVAAVVRNPLMRTPRNYFIINLALSDFLMCTLTVPFTLYYVLNTFWGLGSTSCKIVASAQGVNIFVSAMSITAIGLDRYWVILFPTKTQQQRVVVVICFTFIWIFSFLLAFPLFYATDTQFPDMLSLLFVKCGLYRLVCSEDWEQMVFDKRVYTISSTAFQYVLPLTMLTFVYARIIWRLENRMVYRQRAMVSQFEHSTVASGNANATTNCRMQNRRRSLEVRQRRMNLLLICVVAFFAFCWLPLNVYNGLLSFDLAKYNVVAFSSCHVFGMMSACANPVLYGVFNENFRQEFILILTWLRLVPLMRFLRKLTSARRTNANNENNASDQNNVGGGGGGCGGRCDQLATAVGGGRASLKKSGGSRKNSHRGNNRLASTTDGFQKLLLETPPPMESTTANGYCYTASEATATNYCPSTPPTVHMDEFDLGGLSGGGDGVGVEESPKKKLDALEIANSTPEEKTPLFSSADIVRRNERVEDVNFKSYVLTTDL